MSAQQYRFDLETLIASTRPLFPRSGFWVSRVRVCAGRPLDARLREAQNSVVDPAKRIFCGPDTDTPVAIENRYDGCQFSSVGQNRLADLWLRAL